MTFTTIRFCLFFVAVFVIYTVCKQKYRKYVLLLANILFYLSLDVKMFSLAMFTAIAVFYVGIKVETNRRSNKAVAKKYFVTAVVVLLLVLFLAKYLNFFTETIDMVLEAFGITSFLPVFEVLAWLGLSYYSLKAISYLADVYTGKISCERDVIIFINYLLFFPQIVAGPIGRASGMLPQLRKGETVSKEEAAKSIQQIVNGYFKKLVIANMVTGYVTTVYADVTKASGLTCLLAAFLYSMEIYCDFSGYSDISIGVSRLLGVSVPENFNCPYMAKSIKEFWRRWHISLSSFLTEYVYIPLGGSRLGDKKKVQNTLVTFLVSGLWHGASWTFVFWGLYHGVCNCFCKRVKKGTGQETDTENVTYMQERNLFKTVVTFLLVTVGWIFFRADSFSDAFCVLKNMVCHTSISVVAIQETLLVFTGDMMSLAYGLMSMIMIGLLLIREYRYTYGDLSEGVAKKKQQGELMLRSKRQREQQIWLIFAVFAIICMGNFGTQGFIYANF